MKIELRHYCPNCRAPSERWDFPKGVSPDGRRRVLKLGDVLSMVALDVQSLLVSDTCKECGSTYFGHVIVVVDENEEVTLHNVNQPEFSSTTMQVIRKQNSVIPEWM